MTTAGRAPDRRSAKARPEAPSRARPARLACLVVPLFPLAARLRSEPELGREAVAILQGNGNAACVVAATRNARRAGIRPGFTLPQARALVPKLIARGRDAVSERAAQEALLETAESFSPRVEDAGEGVAYLDVQGLERHLASRARRGPARADRSRPSATAGTSDATDADARGARDATDAAALEHELGRALIAAAARAGLPVRVGIASSKLAAKVAAGLPDSPTRVPAGEEAAFLSPLPLAKLSPELETAATLSRWGISTIGDLARLAPGEVASRLGDAGHELHHVARGLDPRPLVPRQPPPDFQEGSTLEWPLVTLEPFLAMATGALERLAERLAAQGLGCMRLDLTLQLDPDGQADRSISLPAPTRDVKTLLELVRLDLEREPPGAPVLGFSLRAHPDRPRAGQLTLFGPTEISPERLASVLAKLFSMLGEDRVGAPGTVDGHRPERAALVPYAPPPPPLVRHAPRGGRGLLAVRVLRPAPELEVLVEENARADPSRLRSLKTLTSTPAIAGSVRVASGPWTLEEAWWSEEPVSRDYWDVELAGGGLYRIYRERATERWFLDGVYD